MRSSIDFALSAVAARVNLALAMLENGMTQEAANLLRSLSRCLPDPSDENKAAALSQAQSQGKR